MPNHILRKSSRKKWLSFAGNYYPTHRIHQTYPFLIITCSAPKVMDLKGRKFKNEEDLKRYLGYQDFFDSKSKEFYARGIRELPRR